MSDSDSASSDTDADTVAADTTTAVPSPRWWRNRRRGFYLIVTAASVALLWGGWSWWYRAGFPMPVSDRRVQFGGSLGYLSSWMDWKKEKLLSWKWQRETGKLQIGGTEWTVEDASCKLTFTEDGIISVTGIDGSSAAVSKREGDNSNWDTDVNLKPYYFDPNVNLPFGGIESLFLSLPEDTRFDTQWNLVIPDSNWKALLVYDGLTLEICFFHESEDRAQIRRFFRANSPAKKNTGISE